MLRGSRVERRRYGERKKMEGEVRGRRRRRKGRKVVRWSEKQINK